jgi:adenine-specific DNA-methyltransferase
MGTKRSLAALVGEQVRQCQPGPLLDAFSGMCAVGSAIAAQRQVWTNDLQHFAARVAHAFFCSDELPPRSLDAADQAITSFRRQQRGLRIEYEHALLAERVALDSGDAGALLKVEEGFGRNTENNNHASTKGRGDSDQYYTLFTSSFSGSYIGISQCIDIDSLRYSVDTLAQEGRISSQQYEWLCLALCKAMARCSTSTGHFAQPLAVKSKTFDRHRRQRRRSIWKEWISAIDLLEPIGTSRWRSKNRNFQRDAVELLQCIDAKMRPGVVYADPPYTSDQYSRYYHLYDTLMLYDHPALSGRGLYREDRAVSGFSLKAGVESAFQNLIAAAAKVGSDLVLSYPTNGLLDRSRERIPEMLRCYFRYIHAPVEVAHTHSAMGASKGAASYSVVEVIYRATA